MKQEDKELLLRDLCARLPCGVKCKWEHEYDGKTYTGGGMLCDIDHVKTSSGYKYWDCYFEDEGQDIPIELVKPYLRPMSSMTDEEKDIYDRMVMCNASWVVDDWLNKNMFDYRGLIPKCLALEAPEGMYNS